MWYPKNKYCVVGHAELAASESVIEGTVFYQNRSTYAEAVDKAMSNGYGFYEFLIDLPDDQLASTLETIDLSIGNFSYNMCIGSAIQLVSKSSDFYVPPVIRSIPLFSAMYLGALSLIPGSKVNKVSYIGRNNPYTDWISLSIFGDLVCTYNLYLIGSAVYGALFP